MWFTESCRLIISLALLGVAIYLYYVAFATDLDPEAQTAASNVGSLIVGAILTYWFSPQRP